MACSCMPFTVEQHFCKSDSIFQMRVISDKQEIDTKDNGLVSYDIKIEKIFKSNEKVNKKLDSAPKIWTSDSSASCGLTFIKDQVYIVAGYLVDNKLMASSCGLHRKVDDLEEEEKKFFDAEYRSVKCE